MPEAAVVEKEGRTHDVAENQTLVRFEFSVHLVS